MKKEIVIAVCNTYEKAEQLVTTLQQSGFNMKKLSIIGKSTHQETEVMGNFTTDNEMKGWKKNGAFWGGLWGMVYGSGFFLIPDIGSVIMAGPFVASFVSSIEEGNIDEGLSALGVAFYKLGIPKNSILKYESDLNSDKFLILTHGILKDIEEVKNNIINVLPSIEVSVHH
jgi:uncharacterized membrane protein